MIIPDTSIWIDHIHHADSQLAELLGRKNVLVHSFVIGEISLGSMKQYDAIIESLSSLPVAPTATEEEVRFMIKRNAIMGSGIGYVDAHLLASALLTDDAFLWTRDKRLHSVASRLDVAWKFHKA
jgi:predicted nucleic acid-binding protein